MPYSSLKVALNELETEGVIYRDSVQRGPKSFTILILQIPQTPTASASLMGQSGTHYGEQEHVGFSEPAAGQPGYANTG